MLEIWKRGTPKGRVIQGTAPPKTSARTVDKEKVCGLLKEKQTLLEMGTGEGGRGKRGGGGGKRSPGDKIEFEDHLKKDDDEDDSSTETSLN